MTDTILAQEVRYSTRNTRGRHFQRLLLDTARCLMPLLPTPRQAREWTSLFVEADRARLSVSDKIDGPVAVTLIPAQIRMLSLMGSTLARQIKRLTGAISFEVSTWHNTLPSQPVELCLITISGQRLRLHNPSWCAHRYFQAIVALSQSLEMHFGTEARHPQDLDNLIQAGLVGEWIVEYAPPRDIRPGDLHLNWAPSLMARIRASAATATMLPESLIQVEEYEAALAAGTIRQASRWGQEGAEIAAERTKMRQARLNPTLTADLVPLSRSLKETSIEELKTLADSRPLSHLAVEFGVSDKALAKRLTKAGWVSPRSKKKAMRGR